MLPEKPKKEDAPGIVETHVESWIAAYKNDAIDVTREKIEKIYANRPERITRWETRIENKDDIWVAKIEDKVVGFIAPKIEDGKHRVGALYLRPEAFGKGIGKALLEKVLALYDGHPIYLDVVIYNQRAKAFYKKMGFEYTGHTQNFTLKNSDISLPVEEMVYFPPDPKK